MTEKFHVYRRIASTTIRTAAVSFLWFTVTAGSILAQTNGVPYHQDKDVIIAQVHGVAITMDVFRPANTGNGIGIIDVVSGAWSSDRGKIRDHKFAQLYDIFCRRGYTVFAIRPGSLSRFSAADMVNHIETGIREIKDRATEYKIDPDRLGITGASAGGHLASLVALRQTSKIAAAGIFFPPTDFLMFGTTRIDPTKDDRLARIARALAFPGGVSGLDAEQQTAGLMRISPAHQVTVTAPPFLLIHGDADKVVPLQQSQTLLAELKAKDIDAELIVKEGGGHPWLTIPVEVAKLADWFDEQLLLVPVEQSAKP